FLTFFLCTAANVTATRSTLDVCPKLSANFTVAFLHDPPYVKANSTKRHGLLYDFVEAGLGHCFRQYHCNTKAIHWREVFSEDHLSSVILDKQADIAVPITPSLSSSLTEELTDLKNNSVTLVTVVKSPGLALVIDYHACKMKIEELTTSTILSAWPVVAVILLLAGISGISIWALETSTNQQDFPSSFGRGSSEGFWWALVTMTTVGYGDKVPRTIYGRIFSVLWILTGVCLIAIFTAAVTSAITVSSVDSDCKSIQGKHLAALNGSAAEKEARHQGANVTTYETESKMFDSLQAGEVEGVMLDRYKAYYYLDQLKNDHFRVALLIDASLEYGVALMDRGFPEFTAKNGCLAKYFDNSHRLDRTMKHYISPVKPLGSATDTVGVLSINSTANQQLLIASVCIYVLFLVSGLSWEFLYRRNYFNLFNSTSHDKATTNQPPIAEQLAEVQEALSKLTAQVQKIQQYNTIQYNNKLYLHDYK
ncbi:hypothetical protein ACROYT_G010055, partial [Oculina patagonica]